MYKNVEKKYELVIRSYLFLLIFTAINREFKPWGFDLRYALFINIVVIFVFWLIYIKNEDTSMLTLHLKDNFHRGIFFLYFLAVMRILISILLNKVSHDYRNETINLYVLIAFNFVNIIILLLARKKIYKEDIKSFFLISMLFLLFSIAFIYFYGDMERITSSSYRGYAPLVNFVGTEKRIGGFAEDPNYASFFISLLIIYIVRSNRPPKMKFFLVTMIIPFVLITASKTVYLMFLLSFVYVSIKKALINKNKRKWVYIMNAIGVFIVPILIFILMTLNLKPLSSLDTMSIRYEMWDTSLDMFRSSPLIGLGIGEFRTFFARNGGWFVQSHSTLFQLLSEMGVIGFVVYYISFFKFLNIQSKLLNQVAIILLGMTLNFELLYLQFFAFSLVLLSLGQELDDYCPDKKELNVFLINTWQAGGAETVVRTLVRESSEKKPTLYIGFDSPKPKNNLFVENISSAIKIPLISEFLSLIKLNYIYWNYSSKYEVNSVTAHLPKVHFFTKISDWSKHSFYVIHGSLELFSNKFLPRFLYTNEEILYLSSQTTQEFHRNKIKPLSFKKIKNPIDLQYIENQSNEKMEWEGIGKPYILWIGRFDKNKNPMLALDVMKNKKISDKYDLLFLGDGVLKSSLEESVFENKLDKKVHFCGYVENPYPYLKNASLVLNTSKSEMFPMTILEAIALNAKVYTTKSGCWVKDVFMMDRVTLINLSTQKLKNNNYFVNQVENILENNKQNYIKLKINDYSSESVFNEYDRLDWRKKYNVVNYNSSI